MKFPVDWLNEYLQKPLVTADLARALERAGIEVEEISTATALDKTIVVGQVTALRPHPNADKLQVATVDVEHTTLQIVCGAPNIAVGQRVPVAQIGAKLPDGTIITAAKLRGVTSQGMICSEQELDLTQNHAGIMVLSETARLGSPVATTVSKSDVIDTTTAANRWDLNGLIWVAQEVAAHSGAKIAVKHPEQLSSSSAATAIKQGLEVTIASPKLVPRYQLARLSVDAAKPSPSWLQQRLQAAGVRSINNVVDITNYVMIEYGQPLHAFDAAKVTLPITVRTATKGEKLVTLDGTTRTLNPADLLIADAVGPIGLAGVMGGRNAEIDTATTEIYLESASFDGPTLRHSARRHTLRTDASARFERTIPIDLAPLALARAVQLLTELADTTLIAGPVDLQQGKATTTNIAVQPQRIAGLLGLEVSQSQITTQLAKLAFTSAADSAGLSVTPPWWRPDVQHEADTAEEVIKLIGYDRLPATLPTWRPATVSFDQRWPNLWRAKAALRASDLFEVVTYSFISENQITALGRDPKTFLKLKNPLSIEQAYLRTDLLPSLLQAAETNRTYARRFGLFEFSKVYRPAGEGKLPDEPTRLAVLVRTPAAGQGYVAVKAVLDRLEREFNLELIVEPGAPEAAVGHPTRSARIMLAGDQTGGQKGSGREGATHQGATRQGATHQIGWIGQLNPLLVTDTKLGGEVGYLELDWEPLVAASAPVRYREVSRFPGVARDVAVVVGRDVTWQQVAAKLRQHDYQASFVNDYYGSDLSAGQQSADKLPADKKVLALRLQFSSPDTTLTDAEADQQLQQVVKLLETGFKAKLRQG